jgi:HD-GYP domain-containing protein (c-di-GMP phosphodiesterase class II)
MAHEQAVVELKTGAGSTYDPEVVDALLDLLGVDRPALPDRALGVRLAARVPKLDGRRR